MKKIFAKFNSKCAETNKPLKKGTEIYYDYNERKAYHLDSNKVKNYLDHGRETEAVKGYIQAQENAYFERYTSSYYSF